MADVYTEQEKADLAKKRGAAAAQIKDPDEKRKFISAHGDAEAKNKLDTSAYNQMSKDADNTLATGGLNKETGLKTYHKGTDYVPKTGPAVLKKGEAVLKPSEASAYRMAKSALSGEEHESKPKKELKEMRIRKGHGGKGHIVEHHHTRPEHHPMEEHVLGSMADLHKHMDANMPDEAEAQDNPAEEAAEGPQGQAAQALGSISNAG